MKKYFNYHKHDHISNIFTPDTHSKPQSYIDRAKQLDHEWYSTCNHGSGGDIFESKDLCEKNNLKCIFVIEGYIVKDPLEKDNRNYHIILIPKTNIARKKLNLITSRANVEGFYYKPRIFLSDLLSLDKDDLYISTACMAGIIRDDDSINDIFLPLINHFGRNVFLEVQNHNHEEQKRINKLCLDFANKYNLELVAANDSHYIYPWESKDRLEFLKGKGINYGDEDSFLLDYPNYDEMFRRFQEQGVLNNGDIARAIDNTLLFTECEEIYLDKSIKMPTCYPNLSADEKIVELKKHIAKKFKEICKEENINGEKLNKYKKGIQYEMQIIEDTKELNTADYFLLNEQIVDLAVHKYNGILTRSGRGCFTKDALVHTKNGLFSIKDIKIGDEVITQNGEFNKVINTMFYDIEEPLVKIHHLYGTNKYNPTICTLDHKILINRNNELQWVEAANISNKDFVCVPKIKYQNFADEYIDLVKYNKFNYEFDDKYIYEKRNNLGEYKYSVNDVAKQIGVGETIVSRYAKGGTKAFSRKSEKLQKLLEYIPFETQKEYMEFIEKQRTRKIKRFIKNDKILNRFIGLMYGDGFTHWSNYRGGFVDYIGLSINIETKKNIINRNIFNEVANRVGLIVYENKSKKNKLSQLIIRSDVFGNYIAQEFFVSQKHKDKIFNTSLFYQNKENLIGLREGLFLSDGYQDKNSKDKRENFDNTSNSLINAYKILCLMTENGVPAIKFRNDKIDNRGYNLKPSYKLTINHNSNNSIKRKERTKEDEKYYYLPIKKIEFLPKQKTRVYDLTIENEHSYLINNMIVHNSCGSFYINRILGMTQIDRFNSPIKLYPERFISTARLLENRSLPD